MWWTGAPSVSRPPTHVTAGTCHPQLQPILLDYTFCILCDIVDSQIRYSDGPSEPPGQTLAPELSPQDSRPRASRTETALYNSQTVPGACTDRECPEFSLQYSPSQAPSAASPVQFQLAPPSVQPANNQTHMSGKMFEYDYVYLHMFWSVSP